MHSLYYLVVVVHNKVESRKVSIYLNMVKVVDRWSWHDA